MKGIDTLDSLISVYRCRAEIILHPTLCAPFEIQKKRENHTVFHYVERGSCYIECGDSGRQLANEGDIFVLSRGSSHLLIDPRENDDSTPTATLICCYFELDHFNDNLLLNQLPELLIIRSGDQSRLSGMRDLVGVMTQEVNSEALGTQSIINRCAEALFVYILRAWSTLQDSPVGVLGAFSDAKLSKALGAFHARFSYNWSLEELAKEAGMSRSAFASQFRLKMGITPIAYITQWRMQWAARQIKEQKCKISEVAYLSGYKSEVSFSRAFKSHFGFSPSTLKHNQHAI